jgi:hypothetical protein
MIVIGFDFHPGFQQIAVLDMESGECGLRKLMHARGEAERFYRSLVRPSWVGIESVGNTSGCRTAATRPGAGRSSRLARAARDTPPRLRKCLVRKFD